MKKIIITERQFKIIYNLINEDYNEKTSFDICKNNVSKHSDEAENFWLNKSNLKINTIPTSTLEIKKFQLWVKKKYPYFNLGPFGPKRDGVDGKFGKRTKRAWDLYSKFYTKKPTNQQSQNTVVTNLQKKIENDITNAFNKAKKEYIEWFSKPTTVQKFKNKSLPGELKKYISSLSKIKMFKTPKNSPTDEANAWVMIPRNKQTLNDPQYKTIYVNIFKIHDGKKYLLPIEHTIKHEMAHLIDSFITQNKEMTYIPTHQNFGSQDEYMQNYIISDNETYSRLNNLRVMIDSEPMDNGEKMLDKFLDKVNQGEISVPNFKLSKTTKDFLHKKNNTSQANTMYRNLSKSIFVDNKTSFNIEQLFAEFSYGNPSEIYVSFDAIGRLNITSKEVSNLENSGKKYYYLKMTKK